jgi:hypothetical protein
MFSAVGRTIGFIAAILALSLARDDSRLAIFADFLGEGGADLSFSSASRFTGKVGGTCGLLDLK